MDEKHVDSTVEKYLLSLKNTSNFNDKLKILIIISDVIKFKKLSEDTTKRLITAIDCECMLSMLDASSLGTCQDALSENEETVLNTTNRILTKLIGKYIDTSCSEAIMTICSISNLCLQDVWVNDLDAVESLLLCLTKKLAFKHEIESFEICDWLSQIIPGLPLNVLQMSSVEPWQTCLYGGLSSMILSKLSPKFLNKALKLANVTFDFLSIEWLLSQHKGKKLFIATVNLACIEIRLFLENNPFKSVVENYAEVRASYSIVEIASQYLISESTILSEGNILQLNASLQKVSDIIISFIKENMDTNIKSNVKDELFIILTIKSLCALLADENRSSSDDLLHILNYLVETICYQFQYLGNEDLADCAMPAICNLTFEEAPRKILLDLKMEDFLLYYIKHQWKKVLCSEIINKHQLEKRTDKLLVPFNILLNIVTLEPDRVVKNLDTYTHLHKFILTKTNEIPKETEFIHLTGVFCTLGTAILEQTCKSFEENDDNVFSFMQCVITFVWDAFELHRNNHTFTSTCENIWEAILDPWLLTMKNLCGIIENLYWIATFCIDSEWPRTVCGYLKSSDESLEISVKNSFEDIFIALYKFIDLSKSDFQLDDLKLVAKKQNMKKLLNIIK